MRYILLVAMLFLSSCGLFTAQNVPAALAVVKTVAAIVEEETGRSLDELPHECETERTDDGKLLLLCTFDLSGD